MRKYDKAKVHSHDESPQSGLSKLGIFSVETEDSLEQFTAHLSYDDYYSLGVNAL